MNTPDSVKVSKGESNTLESLRHCRHHKGVSNVSGTLPIARNCPKCVSNTKLNIPLSITTSLLLNLFVPVCMDPITSAAAVNDVVSGNLKITVRMCS
jgi:hypothetical protein